MRLITAMQLALLLVGLSALAASADKIDLANGDTIDVVVVEETEEVLVVEHPQLGRMEIPRSELKPPEPDEPGLFGTPILRGWRREVTAGLSGSQGNSKDFNVNAGVTVDNETKTYRGWFNAAWFFSTSQPLGEPENRTTNQVAVVYQHDFLFEDSDFYLFANSRYAYDQFQDWRNRVTGSGGAGYQFLDGKRFKLRGELGAGFNWSEYPGAFIINLADPAVNTDNWRGELVVAAIFAWHVSDGQKFLADVTYLPNVSSWSEFRVLANAAYEILLSRTYDLSLKVGVKDEYDTEARPEKNNLKYYGNLVYEF